MLALIFLAFCSTTLRWNVFWHPQLRNLRKYDLAEWWWKWSLLRFLISGIVAVLVTIFTPVTFRDWNGQTFCLWAASLALLINCVMSSTGVDYDKSEIVEEGGEVSLSQPIAPVWLNLFYVISVGGLIVTTISAAVRYFG
ncbi:MAG: hypothetical protein HZA80_00040 [Candidatus Taylorbacteria bacterium]|nr:hypothetical protein [Candidatus Taylorbacteria bacterium]